jgi:hypothetical protein
MARDMLRGEVAHRYKLRFVSHSLPPFLHVPLASGSLPLIDHRGKAQSCSSPDMSSTLASCGFSLTSVPSMYLSCVGNICAQHVPPSVQNVGMRSISAKRSVTNIFSPMCRQRRASMSLAPTGEESESSNPPVQRSNRRWKDGGGWQGRPEWYEVNQGA